MIESEFANELECEAEPLDYLGMIGVMIAYGGLRFDADGKPYQAKRLTDEELDAVLKEERAKREAINIRKPNDTTTGDSMALASLKGVTSVRGEPVVTMDTLREVHPERFTETGAMDHKWFEETIRPSSFIYVRHDKNSLSFTLQNGPIKEVGKNGCQVVDVIAVAKLIIEKLNAQFPCRENAMTITKLDEAIMWQDKRTQDRIARDVEGQSKA